MKCFICDLNDESTHIKDFKYWIIRTSLEQHTPGCLLIILNRHEEDIFLLNAEELRELKEITQSLRKVLTTLFNPDWFNYLLTNNSCHHIHIHLIPRYKKEITFCNKKYKDQNYGDMVLRKTQPEDSTILKSLKKEILNKL